MAKNNYIPEYVPPNLLWYDRDGLITWYNQRKCEEFLKNPKEHFDNTKIVNFGIIRREAKGKTIPEDLLKKYQTVTGKDVIVKHFISIGMSLLST